MVIRATIDWGEINYIDLTLHGREDAYARRLAVCAKVLS